jgi:transposase
MPAIPPISDLQFEVANTETGVIQAPEPGPRIMRYELTDFEWAAIRPFLPNKPRGVPRVNDRRVLNGIFWILRSGAPWRNLPEGFWPYITCYNRFVRWRMAGIWDLIMEALAEAHDGCVQMIDTSIVRVHQHGGCAGGGDAYREKVLSIYGAPPRIQILDALIHVDPRHGLLREL